MKIEVSNGEILDKISILSIKLEKVNDTQKKLNIQKEYNELYPLFQTFVSAYGVDIISYYTQLIEVNTILWNIEDELRKMETKSDFGSIFVELARKVYQTNDKRAEIKKQINIFTGSNFIEEKEYVPY